MNGIPVEPRITEYLYQKAVAAGIPFSGTFEVTPLCNMDCKMCYVRMDKKQQQSIRPLATAAQWLDLGQRAKAAGMLYLLVTGGEPFTHPEIQEILEGLHKLGLLVSINTNGTLINEKTVAWLKRSPPVRINISLYGTDNETYHRLCGDKEGFTKVDTAIRLLQAAGIPVKLSCSLTPENAHDLPRITAYAKGRGLVVQVATYMFPPVRKDAALVGQNHRFTPEEAARQTALSEYLALGKERFLAQRENICLPNEEDTCGETGSGVQCRAGRCSFWVTWEGKVSPCGMLPCTGESAFDGDFLALWEKVKADTAAIRLPARCSGCSLQKSCRACAAMVYCESGCFDKVPQYRCQMSKAYPAAYADLADQLDP